MKKIKYLVFILPFLFFACGGNEADTSQNNSVAKAQTYYCPMHPEVTSDKPGVCPICHMDLVLKADETASDNMEGMISLSARKQVLANVATVKAIKQQITKTVKAYSYLDFAENNRKTIAARFNGRIEKLYVDKTGDVISVGQPLFEIYSPDLIQAQNELLIAVKNKSENLIASSRKKLELLGLTEKQIDQIQKSEQVSFTTTYYSPIYGTVIEKKVQDGIYVNEGTVIYDVADLSKLWNIAEVYENDIEFIKTNSKVTLKLSAYPSEKFEGKVNLIYPVLNSQTRTIKVRSEFNNKQNMLKPNMFGEAFFNYELGNYILIPSDAIIMTGKRNIVWVKVDDKLFEAREVKLGNKINDSYQILSGINEGDELAASGGYLIDSESQLKSGVTAVHQHGETKTEKNVTESMNHENDDTKMESKVENTVSKSEIAKLIETDETPFNAVCPILGEKISKKSPKVSYKGKIIAFCCPGCDDKFISNPKKYFANLSKDGKSFIGKVEDEE